MNALESVVKNFYSHLLSLIVNDFELNGEQIGDQKLVMIFIDTRLECLNCGGDLLQFLNSLIIGIPNEIP